ncbi:MAG: IS21 family transposase [Vulcanimicrobiaceae bacterium]
MSIWLDIRTRHRDGESIKSIARATGTSKNTVKKYLQCDAPPRERDRAGREPRMARFQAEVDGLIRESPTIRAPRIVELLRRRVDANFRVGERAARNYVASRRARIAPKEVFVRLTYAPGDQMQFDFKDVLARIGGAETSLHMFVARLSYSTKWFARCYRTEDRPALFDGLLEACKAFGGVPREGVFDNASTAVDRVLRSRARIANSAFAEFCGSLMLRVEFAAPAKGNEKGGVEGLHGYIEDNVFLPMPDVVTLDHLNDRLSAFCDDDTKRVVAAGETVHSRFAIEALALRPLPTVLPEPCIREYARINKFSEATYKTNRYSVPTAYAHRNAIVECYATRVRIVVDDSVAADHRRCFGKQQSILDPLHFIDVLSLKHRAVEHAAVFMHERFPAELKALLRSYVENDRLTAGRKFMRVIALLRTYPLEQVINTVELARIRGTSDPGAIAFLLDQASSPRYAAAPLVISAAITGAARPNVDMARYATEHLVERAS